MERKEKIYLYINSAEYIPLTFDEMMLVLDVPEEDAQMLLEILEELISVGKVFLTKKKRYAPVEKNGMISGIFRYNPRGGFGFVTPDSGDDIYIPASEMQTAIDGDSVLVKLSKTHGKKREGRITSILERNNTTLSAVMTDDFIAFPDSPKVPKQILLEGILDAKRGDRVLVEITEFAQNGKLYGEVISVLGSSRELKSYTEAIIYANGIKPKFPDEVINQAESFGEEVTENDIADREDLTDKTIFTIDGDDARDFDDAVSLEIAENGNYILGVHIADVTHYVTEDSPLDKEAYTRGTSVYLADRVIPMLPKTLSNGLCSLNPHVVRLTLSVFMEIDKNGDIKSHRIAKTFIRSCHRMTYNDVAKILDGDKALTEKYSDIRDTLTEMNALAKTLLSCRTKRGSINFDFPESKVVLDEKGQPCDIVKLVRNDAHKLIEEFMLIANESVAEYAFWADIPFVYRVHDEPDTEKMESFRRFIGGFGLFMKGNDVHPKDLQRILDEIKYTEDETLISTYMLRSLMKAEYRSSNDGHFGLAAKYYCHFTSPIRRYPDLTIHRILKEFLDGNDIMHYQNKVDDISKQSSDTERGAELCEREVSDLFKTAYIADYVGCVLPATVSGVTSFGMFAELDNTIEGLIRLETIQDDYYEYIEEQRLLIGTRKGKTYQVGDRIEIEVVRADLSTRQIDFVLNGSRVRKPSKPTGGSRKFRQFTTKKYKTKRK